MATWKKILTEGSDISELTNDSNYLTSVPSHSASLVTSGTFTTARIPNLSATKITSGTFATARIADDAITSAKIGDDAVNSQHYVQRSIDTEHLEHDSVTATKLAVNGNGSLTNFLKSEGDGTFAWAVPTNTNTTYTLDLTENNPDCTVSLNPSTGSTQDWNLTSEGSIQFNTNESTRETSVDVTEGSITTARLDSNAVTTAKIANLAVTGAKMANNTITGTQLNTYAVNSSSILGTAVVTSSKLGDGAVTPIKSNLGWHTQTKIFVPPSEFKVNDDQNYGNLALMDNGGQAKVMYAVHEGYANVPIPSGYKVTHWRINGTASVAASAYYSTIAIGTTTTAQVPQSQYTNNTNITNPSSGITADDTNGRYFILGWHPTSVSQYLYGAVLTIAKI
jgi:hypothetical protein